MSFAFHQVIGMLKKSLKVYKVIATSWRILKAFAKYLSTAIPVRNSTLEALKRIPAIQGEFEFYEFIRQRFEKVYDTFITNSGK